MAAGYCMLQIRTIATVARVRAGPPRCSTSNMGRCSRSAWLCWRRNDGRETGPSLPDPATGAPPVGGSAERSCPGPDCGGPGYPTGRLDVFCRLPEACESPAGGGDAGRVPGTELKVAG